MAPGSANALDPNAKRSVWFPLAAILFLSLAAHVGLALHYPLSEDETYYWDWSRNLDWGYYDQGPMIAWVIRGFCSLLGDTPIGVRIGAIVVALAVQVVAFLTVRRLFDGRAALWSVLTLTVTPLAVVGGFIFTYDALLILFWATGIYGLTLAVQDHPKIGWLIVGLSLGFGLLSKLTMALFLPCALLFLLNNPERRSLLKTPEPWIALLLGTAMVVPNLIWQANHEWATLSHMRTLSRANLGKGAIERIGDFIGSQIAVISPLLFIVLVVALCTGWKRRSDWRLLLLWCFSAPVLGLFFVNTFNSKVLANWPAAGWYSICLVAGVLFTESSVSKATAWLFRASLVFAAVLSTIATYPEGFAALGIEIPIWWNRPSNKMFGGEELARAASQFRNEVESKTGRKVHVVSTEYQQIGRLGFYLPGQPRVPCFYAGTRPSDYMFRTQGWRVADGDDAILVLQTEIRESTRKALGRAFDSIDENFRQTDIFRASVHDEPVRKYFLYHLTGYRKAEGDALRRPN